MGGGADLCDEGSREGGADLCDEAKGKIEEKKVPLRLVPRLAG